MKSYSLLFLCLAFSTVYAHTDTSGINFEQNLSWEEIKSRAKEDNKFIFLDLYTTWCAPCKAMDKEVYPNDSLGELMNTRFISAKVQMDSTGKDIEAVKRAYPLAKYLNEKYKITAYPSYLFFSPNGQLVYKARGLKTLNQFIDLARLVIHPKTQEVFTSLENYKKGEKDYQKMPQLIEAARDLLNDVELTNSIAKDYKVNYIDKLNDSSQLSQENLNFISVFPFLLSSSDRIFHLITANASLCDSMKDGNNWTEKVKSYVINKEEIMNRLFSDDSWTVVKTETPNWSEIRANVFKKYGEKYNNLVISAQLLFYSATKDWRKFAETRETKTKLYPLQVSKDLAADNNPFMLNYDAWTIFLHCSDTTVLKRALNWMNRLLPIESNEEYLDTKANLQYKLGYVSEAVQTQTEASHVARERLKRLGMEYDHTKFDVVIDKMKKGIPTWPSN